MQNSIRPNPALKYRVCGLKNLIKQHQLAALAQENIDIVIMGSAITKADDITAACQACRKEMQ